MKHKEKKNKKVYSLKIMWQLFATFFKIGLFTFGGGLAMISLIERETVENRKWVTSEDIVNMVAIAESTPGVIAINSATFVGYRVGGFFGSIIASLAVTLPSLIIITVLSYFIDTVNNNFWINAAFKGIRAGVTVLILNAVFKLVKPMEKSWITILIAITVFVVATVTKFDVIFLILMGVIFGLVYKYLTEQHNNKKSKTTVDNNEENDTNNITAKGNDDKDEIEENDINNITAKGNDDKDETEENDINNITAKGNDDKDETEGGDK